jgi:ribosomal protein L12E/L44/L45/RPP1/RPP2
MAILELSLAQEHYIFLLISELPGISIGELVAHGSSKASALAADSISGL